MVKLKDKVEVPETAKKRSGLAAARGVMNKVFPKDQSSEVSIDSARFTQSAPHLPTGSIVIDFLIGGVPNRRGIQPCPGLPRGRIVNLYGAESSGKTTLALTMARETCLRGGDVCYIDWEHSVDIPYAEALGVPIADESKFMLVQPETLEKGLSYLWIAVKAGVSLVIIDSVAAGATDAQWNQTLGEQGEIGRVGAKAAKWSEFLPKLKALMSKTNTCIVGISQLRAKINTGYGAGKGGGDPTTQQGGMAWKFYSEVRIGLRKVKTEKGKRYDAMTHTMIDVPIGNIVVAKIDKCKVAASQGREAEFFISFGEGIDDMRSVIELATNRGLVKRGGAWYTWERGDSTVLRGQGMEAFKAEILKTDGAWDELKTATMSFLATNPTIPTSLETSTEDRDEEELMSEISAMITGGEPTETLGEDD